MKGNGTDGRAPLQFWANGLNENTLEIKGASGAATGLANKDGTLRNDNQTLGFHLAGVDIPHPNTHTINKTASGTKQNASFTITNSGCELIWAKRTAEVEENGKNVNKNVYVLAFEGCSASGGSTGSTTPTNPGTTEKYVWVLGNKYYLKDSGGAWSTTGNYGCSKMEPIEWLGKYLPLSTPTIGGVCNPAGPAYSCQGEGYYGMYVQEYTCQKQ